MRQWSAADTWCVSQDVTTAIPRRSRGCRRISRRTGPWGYSVASNLTPEPTTEIGTRYTEASFIATMRTGKKPNGTPIMPPMPSDVYQNMTDEDQRAIFAYLRTIKPISNAVYAGLTPPGGATQKPSATQK